MDGSSILALGNAESCNMAPFMTLRLNIHWDVLNPGLTFQHFQFS